MSKNKSIDLGAMQDNLIATKKQYLAAERALERARQVYDSARDDWGKAVQELKEATRTVLG